MEGAARRPRFFDVLRGDGLAVRATPYGQVGTVYSDPEVELVWVSKQAEEIDPGWVRQDAVDLIVVIQGQLKVEFEDDPAAGRVMEPGEVLVLPPGAGCRAYRWPRDAGQATVFLAVYPVRKAGAGIQHG